MQFECKNPELEYNPRCINYRIKLDRKCQSFLINGNHLLFTELLKVILKIRLNLKIPVVFGSTLNLKIIILEKLLNKNLDLNAFHCIYVISANLSAPF